MAYSSNHLVDHEAQVAALQEQDNPVAGLGSRIADEGIQVQIQADNPSEILVEILVASLVEAVHWAEVMLVLSPVVVLDIQFGAWDSSHFSYQILEVEHILGLVEN